MGISEEDDLDRLEEGEVVRRVDELLADALRQQATHLYLEPGARPGAAPIRFRIHGTFKTTEVATPARALAARLKIVAGLDISERRRSQSGWMEYPWNGRVVRARVVTLPTADDREDVVVRFEEPTQLRRLSELGLSSENRERLTRMLARPTGMVLVAGPTGSGKATLMHAILAEMDESALAMYAVGYAFEHAVAGVRQVKVSASQFSMSDGLRACLDADADVILVQELMRFDEIDLAMRESLVRRLVVGGMHTVSAVATVRRILDVSEGLALNFGAALNGVVAVRLVPCLCSKCRESYRAPKAEIEALKHLCGEAGWEALRLPKPLTFCRPKGCGHCKGRGYDGVFGLQEVLVTTPAVAALVARNASEQAIGRQAADEGMRTLAQDGVGKAVQGLIDVAHLVAGLRV